MNSEAKHASSKSKLPPLFGFLSRSDDRRIGLVIPPLRVAQPAATLTFRRRSRILEIAIVITRDGIRKSRPASYRTKSSIWTSSPGIHLPAVLRKSVAFSITFADQVVPNHLLQMRELILCAVIRGAGTCAYVPFLSPLTNKAEQLNSALFAPLALEHFDLNAIAGGALPESLGTR